MLSDIADNNMKNSVVVVVVLAAFCLLSCPSMSVAAQPSKDAGVSTHARNVHVSTQVASHLGHPQYGVCRGTNPACYHDWGNFDVSDGGRILLYTRTAGPRHAALGPPLAPGMDPPLNDRNIVQKGIIKLGKQYGFDVDWTEDQAELSSPRKLFKYNAIVFFSTSRNALNDAAQTSLRIYLEGGGGFVGIHNALGTEYQWPYYYGLLGGTNLYDHPPFQVATVVTQDKYDVSTKTLPPTWKMKDEFYNLIPVPSNVRVLAAVDETTMEKGTRGYYGYPGMGASHPVVWCQYYDGGRSWITTLGHSGKLFSAPKSFPGAALWQQMIARGIQSAMGVKPFCLGKD